MNWRPFLLLAVALALVACSSPRERIRRNPAVYNSLSATDRRLVSQGEIRYGMTPAAVYLAWGHPDERSQGAIHQTLFESWGYYMYTGVAGFGPCYDGSPFYFSSLYWPSYGAWPYPYRKVTFVNNKVVAWASTRR